MAGTRGMPSMSRIWTQKNSKVCCETMTDAMGTRGIFFFGVEFELICFGFVGDSMLTKWAYFGVCLGDIQDKSGIISTRIRVARNIEGFGLAPGQTSPKEKLEIEEMFKKVFATLTGDLKGTYYSLDGMKEEDRQKLIADHFLFKGNDKMQADSGYHRWWAKGRGIYLGNQKTFLCWLNEGDHIRIISMEKGLFGVVCNEWTAFGAWRGCDGQCWCVHVYCRRECEICIWSTVPCCGRH